MENIKQLLQDYSYPEATIPNILIERTPIDEL